MMVFITWASHCMMGVGKDSVMGVGKDSVMGVGKDSSMVHEWVLSHFMA